MHTTKIDTKTRKQMFKSYKKSQQYKFSATEWAKRLGVTKQYIFALVHKMNRKETIGSTNGTKTTTSKRRKTKVSTKN